MNEAKIKRKKLLDEIRRKRREAIKRASGGTT